jgi:hypothetical protein
VREGPGEEDVSGGVDAARKMDLAGKKQSSRQLSHPHPREPPVEVAAAETATEREEWSEGVSVEKGIEQMLLFSL